MYSGYKGTNSYYQPYTHQDDAKKRINGRFDHKSPHQKGHLSKTLRWNIEESKENILYDKESTYPFISPHLSRTESYGFSSQFSTPKANDRLHTDYCKSKFSKSYKAIRHQFDSDYDFSKPLTTKTKDINLYEKKNIEKGLTMSLGYKTNLNDLLPSSYKADSYKTNDRLNEDPYRKVKPSKSQKKIQYDLDLDLKVQRPKVQLLSKSSKNIQEMIAELKLSKKEEKDRVPFSSNKSSKYITDQVPRSKIDKYSSYLQSSDNQDSDLRLKKFQNITVTRTVSTKEIEGRPSKISITDFQLGSCKGEGAFGQVFPAIHKATNMLVAIKKVPKEKVKYMLDQFINQIKIQMFLDHPNIVKLYGFFDDSTHFYIVMEYMEGGNLFNLIKKKKKLTETETSERLKQICLGLKEMHDNSILHRDIKPQNIVLTNDVCKLCDFGWSAICKDRRTTYCGTLDYVSPQLIEGEGYDDSVDIWCIGVLCYQMICGKTPFYNISRKQTMKKIANVTYEYPLQITSKSKGFIDRILKKNPEDRIGIDEVLKDIFLSQ